MQQPSKTFLVIIAVTAKDYQFTDEGAREPMTVMPNFFRDSCGNGVLRVGFYDDVTFDQRLERMKASLAQQPVSMV